MMFSKQELKWVTVMAVALLVVGLAGYAAFPARPPKKPVRIVFQSVAGKALFDHARHADPAGGYGLDCGECHHTLAPEEYEEATSCSECHDPAKGDPKMPKRSDALHAQCIGCHQDYGAGPVECTQCHIMM
jgi:hypothetical protein